MNKLSKIILGFLVLSLLIYISTHIYVNFSSNTTITNISKIFETLSIALSVTFTINFGLTINISSKKEILDLKVKLKNIEIKTTNNINIKYNESEIETPCLSLDVVGYKISESFFPVKQDGKDAVIFINYEELKNNALEYYIILEPNSVTVSNEELNEISNFRKSVFQEIKTQTGTALSDKPYHLFVFTSRNVSKEPVMNLYPKIIGQSNPSLISMITIKKTLMHNEKALFMVLVNYSSTNYDLVLTYSDRKKVKYEQKITFETTDRTLGIYDNNFIPPRIVE